MSARAMDEESIFCEALECSSAEAQAAYLGEACRGDGELRRRVEALLRVRSAHASFLAQPAACEGILPQDLPRSGLDASGTVIGPYKLLERIGEGGFGEVYMAEQTEPVRRRVAIKIIKPGMDTRQVLARFEAEREALALMDHPNIARVLDAGATDAQSPLGPGRPYVVMELVRGVAITRFCDDQRLSVSERLTLLIDACHAVQHAHQKGIIHRDLKPSNVLISRYDDRPVVKIIDFGIAKATGGRLTDKTLFTEFRQMIGTPAYMSPEQAGLSDLDVDTRSDVYSLGVLLYELLTGTTPFEPERLRSAEFDEMRRIIREEEPPRPSTRLNRLFSQSQPGQQAPGAPASRTTSTAAIAEARQADPRSLVRSLTGEPDWIVMKCLDKDRTRRYDTADGLARELDRFLKDEPILAGPPSRIYRFRKFVRRNRAVVTAAAVVGFALLTGLAGTTFGLMRAEHRRIEAQEAQQLAEKREKQTRQVADFQAAMLSEIDVEAMGRGIKERFREQVRAALERQDVGEFPNRRKRTPEEIEAELAAFDQRAGAALAVDVARGVMDEFVLARAADALEKQFADQPLVRAQLRAAIGNTHHNLGAYDAAEPHLRAALEIRSRELGFEHVLVADSLSELGVLLLDKGDYAAAEPVLREALAMCRKILGDEHPAVATALHNLAGLLAATKDYAAAEPLYREALAMRRKLLGDEHPGVVWTLKNLGNLLTDKGDYAAADPLLHEALARARKLWGDQHPDTANTLSALAKLLNYKGDYAAEPMFRDVLAIWRKAYGDEHPYVAAALINLASALTTQSNDAAAEPFFREALAIRRKVFGDEHPDVASNLNMLASALQRQGKYAAAEPLYREVLEIRRRLCGPETANPEVADCLYNLAGLKSNLGSHGEAETLYRDALAMRRELSDEELVARTLESLGNAILSQGRFSEAEELFNEALRLNRERVGDDHPEVVGNLASLAVLLSKQGRLPEAEALNRLVLQWRRGHFGDQHPKVAHVLSNLAQVLAQQGRGAEAEELFREALAIHRAVYGDEHPRVAKLLFNLGVRLVEFGRRAEGENCLRQALAQQRKLLGDHHPDVRQSLGFLANVRRQEGDYDEAVALLREALAIAQRAYPDGNPEAWRRFSVMNRLGGTLADQARVLVDTDRERALALFQEAEPLILTSVIRLKDEPNMPENSLYGGAARRQTLEATTRVFEFWHTVAPDRGWGDRAAEWRAELQRLPEP